MTEGAMLQGKTALVTGSTSGIGLGIARALAAQGCHVMLNGFGDHTAIERARAALEREHGVRVRYDGADLSKPPRVAGLVEATVRELGGIDVLVNNAGIQHTAPCEEFPLDRWDAILATNLSAAFHATRSALPLMRRKGWGRIVNTASVHGLVASAHKAAYVAAKHGLVGLTKVVALETAGSGITCNALCPGWTRTELVEPQIAARAQALGVDLDEGARALLSEKQPSKQFVTVEQLGAVVAFLCSDAAAQLTGAAIPVDGGWTAQ
jgi:3-hydroxybutyrate dehydrogenase